MCTDVYLTVITVGTTCHTNYRENTSFTSNLPETTAVNPHQCDSPCFYLTLHTSSYLVYLKTILSPLTSYESGKLIQKNILKI